MWAFCLDTAPDTVEHLTSLLSANEIARAARFCFNLDRHRFIAAHAFLRTILGRYIGIHPRGIAFEYSPVGKPFMPDWRRLTFNLSHGDDLALVAVTLSNDVGVDVERLRSIDHIDRIAQEFFSRSEYQELLGLDAFARTEAFFHCWTRKEALLKAVGVGLGLPLNSFEVSVLPDEVARLVVLNRQPGNLTSWWLEDLKPAAEHVGAFAVNREKVNVSCWRLAGLP